MHDSDQPFFLLESESEISKGTGIVIGVREFGSGIGINQNRSGSEVYLILAEIRIRVLSFPGIGIGIQLYPKSCITVLNDYPKQCRNQSVYKL